MRLVHPERTLNIIKKHNIKPRKGLGQNFLISEKVLDRIIEIASIDEKNLIIEIGPGIGTLTEALALKAERIVAIEIDELMINILQDTLQNHANVILLHQDFLKTDLAELYNEYKPQGSSGYEIIANLPYYISTPIIQKIIDNRHYFAGAVIMVQKEVAERITAKPGGKEYGSLTVAVQYYLDAEIVGMVPRTAFYPEPKVESAILRLLPRIQPAVTVKNEDLYFKIVYDAFRQRRKTLLNNLKQSQALTCMDRDRLIDVLHKAGISEMRRGETLSMQEFADLTNIFAEISDNEEGAAND